MPKQIILYNLLDGVSEEDYIKWCEDYKCPVMLGVKSAKRFTLPRILQGEKGDGQRGIEPGGRHAGGYGDPPRNDARRFL